MEMICVEAKATPKRDKAIDAIVQKYPELWPQSLGEWKINGKPVPTQYSYINWNEEDGCPPLCRLRRTLSAPSFDPYSTSLGRSRPSRSFPIRLTNRSQPKGKWSLAGTRSPSSTVCLCD